MSAVGAVLGGGAGAMGSTTVSSRVDRVHVDGLVVLKMIKHAHGMLPQFAAGALLGLDESNTLDVTNTFPFPHSKNTDASYQTDMLDVMRKVNVDANIVGWYQSTFLGSYCTKDLVLTQYDFQLHLGSGAVVLIYDPAASMTGTLSLKAMRLTREFMLAFKTKAITVESLASSTVSMNSVFEELPVRVRNPHLINALLLDLQAAATPLSRLPKAGTGAEPVAPGAASVASGGIASSATTTAQVLTCDFDRLDLAASPILRRQLTFLTDGVEELVRKQNGIARADGAVAMAERKRRDWVKQRKEENEVRLAAGLKSLPLEDPEKWFFQPLADHPSQRDADRLGLLLAGSQVDTYCDAINKFTGQSFGKLFLAGSLHK